MAMAESLRMPFDKDFSLFSALYFKGDNDQMPGCPFEGMRAPCMDMILQDKIMRAGERLRRTNKECF